MLFQEGTTWNGHLPALGAGVRINKLGPYLGKGAVWQASGALIEEPGGFLDAESAMLTVEAIVTADGDTVEGR